MGSEVNYKASPRDLQIPVVHQIHIPIGLTDLGKTKRSPAVIPAGSLLIKPMSGYQGFVAFNAGTFSAIDMGTELDPDFYATQLSMSAIAFVPFDEAVTMKVAADFYPSCAPTHGGTAPTLGSGIAIWSFIPASAVDTISVDV